MEMTDETTTPTETGDVQAGDATRIKQRRIGTP